MSTSDRRRERRAALRECARRGCLTKTDGKGNRFCARCGEPMPPEDEGGGAGVREPRRPAPDGPAMAMSL